jgi:hypothetical protein
VVARQEFEPPDAAQVFERAVFGRGAEHKVS